MRMHVDCKSPTSVYDHGSSIAFVHQVLFLFVGTAQPRTYFSSVGLMVRTKNWVGGEDEGTVIAGAISGAGFAYNVSSSVMFVCFPSALNHVECNRSYRALNALSHINAYS